MTTPHDFAGISNLAHDLTREYIDRKRLWEPSSTDPIRIFQSEADARLFAVGFLRFVAEKRVGDYVKNAAITYSNAPLVFPNPEDPSAKELVRAPSWLARDMRDYSTPIIILDRGLLSQDLQRFDSRHRAKVICRLLMHEVGHVALHWSSLLPKDTSKRYVDSATPTQEREAWWFSSAVSGCLLGEAAFRGRPLRIDAAWDSA